MISLALKLSGVIYWLTRHSQTRWRQRSFCSRSPVRSTFTQVPPRLEPCFHSSHFLRLSGVSAATLWGSVSPSLQRTERLSYKRRVVEVCSIGPNILIWHWLHYAPNYDANYSANQTATSAGRWPPDPKSIESKQKVYDIFWHPAETLQKLTSSTGARIVKLQ